MPPKLKITKNDIIKTAVEIVRIAGEKSVNARAIATALGCSTQPIFSNFETMDELQKDIKSAAYDIYLGFLESDAASGRYPEYKAFGMGYIRFAKEESELFKLLFMCDRGGEEANPTADYSRSIDMIVSANGVSREKAELMHVEMWVCVHGIATMMATSYLSLDSELISSMLTDIYQGLRTRHLQEANTK